MRNTSIDIVKVFQDFGYETYWAGGCVRDLLMGKEPQDFDIATSALPEDIEKVIRKSHLLDERIIPIGKQFGIVMAIINGHHFEIATFRSDSDLSDGRRPDAVFFSNPRQDAKRRDFTINGMFYDPIRKEVIDYVGGQEDLRNKVIRFIGSPDRRIKEDYLRILRAVRFKLTLGFTYASTTFLAMKQSAQFVTKTSWERIHSELTKMFETKQSILSFGNTYSFDLVIQELSHVGVLSFVLPEIEALKDIPQPPEYH